MSEKTEKSEDATDPQIRFLAERLFFLDQQFGILTEALKVLGERVKRLEGLTRKIVNEWGGDDSNA